MSSEVIVAGLNLLLLLSNVVWQWSFRKRGNEIQVVQTLTEHSKAKDIIISELEKEKELYKREHQIMTEEYKKLQREVQEYRAQKGSSV